jgi:hypothetical protein
MGEPTSGEVRSWRTPCADADWPADGAGSPYTLRKGANRPVKGVFPSEPRALDTGP